MNFDYLNDEDVGGTGTKTAAGIFNRGATYLLAEEITMENTSIKPSVGDRMTRFVIGVVARVGDFDGSDAAAYWQNVGDMVEDIELAKNDDIDNKTRMQKANRAMAHVFLGNNPRYDNKAKLVKGKFQIYAPPAPVDPNYEELIWRQWAMRKLFSGCAAGKSPGTSTEPPGKEKPDLSLAGSIKDLEAKWKSALEEAFPLVENPGEFANPPKFSFLLIGNGKPGYVLNKSNAQSIVGCLGEKREVGEVYALNFADVDFDADKVTADFKSDRVKIEGVKIKGVNNKLPLQAGSGLVDTPFGELSRAMVAMRRIAKFEQGKGRVLVVVCVQSGFWYHSQHSGVPTVTLTSNLIQGEPTSDDTKLDAELERCHVHLSVRCHLTTLLSGSSNKSRVPDDERSALQDALDALVANHPVFR